MSDRDRHRPPGEEVDLNRVVWDPAYRRRVVERLKRAPPANENEPADEAEPDQRRGPR